MATRMQQRRGTASQWISTNSGNGPILAAGEIGFESDTNKFKVGDGVNHWVDLTYFTDAESITTAISNLIDGAPAALNTLNELAAALGDDANFLANLATETYVDTAVANSTFDAASAAGAGLDWNASTDQFDVDSSVASTSYVDTSITTHSNDTTSVHGISDTAALATKDYADGAVGTHSLDTTSVHGIADTADLATKGYADGSVSVHNADTTNVHGILNTADLATNSYVTTSISTHSDDTTGVHGISDTAELATKTYADSAVSTHSSDTTSVHGISDTAELATKTYADSAASTAVSNHQSDTTSIHGIADTSLLATTTNVSDAQSAAQTYADSAVSTHNSDTTSVHGIADTSALATKTYADNAATDAAATVTKLSLGLNNVDNTSDANKPISTATQTALDDKLSLAGGTMTGALTLSGAPSSDLHAVTKLYVDNVIAGINFHEAVHAASVNNLAANYSNGTSGVGATLTADTNRAFNQIDGESVVVGQRVLIKNQTDAKQNGIYVLTTNGSGSTPWVLTRATDSDNNPTGEMKNGDFTFVQAGTVNASIGYINNSSANPIVIGTDNITYAEFNAAKTVVAGNGLQEATPGIISIDTAVTATKDSVDLKAPINAPTFTGLVTVAASGVAFTDGTQTKEGVPSRTLIIQKTSSYTLTDVAERDELIEMGSSSAMTLTIPADSTLNFPVGTSIDVLQTSTGQVTIAGAGGVTVNATPGLKLRTQWSSATLFKRAANTWVVMGDLSA
jgi:hypothetical protein